MFGSTSDRPVNILTRPVTSLVSKWLISAIMTGEQALILYSWCYHVYLHLGSMTVLASIQPGYVRFSLHKFYTLCSEKPSVECLLVNTAFPSAT